MKWPWGKKGSPVSISGPVERDGDRLALMIPLESGGAALAECVKEIGRIQGDSLRIEIPDWLAERLEIAEGSRVIVDNLEGKFRITRSG